MRQTLGLTLLVPLLLSAVCFAGRYEPGEAVCPRTTARLTIDGKLDEPAWRKAAQVGPLVTLGARAKADYPATAMLLRDESALYVAVKLRALPLTKPKRARAATVWGVDHVEVFLDPSPDSEDYYQLVFDRRGRVWSAWVTQKNVPNKGAAWEGAWRVAVAQTEGGWTAEMVAPFAAFGLKGVKPGDLWRFRIGRDGGPEGQAMWPPNPTNSFHARVANAALYFDKRNLMVNGDFESGKLVRGLPLPWRANLTSREVEGKFQGTVETVSGGVKPGRRAVRFTKVKTALWWPRLRGGCAYRLKPGGVYEFSIMVKGDLPKIAMRAVARRKRAYVSMGQAAVPGEEFKRHGFRFVVPDGADTVRFYLSAPSRMEGEALYDNAVLRRVLISDQALRAQIRAYRPPDWSPHPDPIHGLEAMCERAGRKPWNLFWRKDGLLTYRVMFKDRKYGTELWLLDKIPGCEPTPTASIWTPWNCDGSVLMLPSARWTPKGNRRGWLCNADFSHMKPKPVLGTLLWDLEDPDVYYVHFLRGKKPIARVNILTGEVTELARWKQRVRQRAYAVTRDNRWLFVVDHDGGTWVPYTPGAKPLPEVNVLDCWGTLNGRQFRSLGIASRTRKDGHLFRILVGTLVHTRTGRTKRVIAPISGRTEYLKTFASGRVKFPADAELPKTKDLKELFKIYNYYPSCSHGHLSYSPDGEYVCWDRGGVSSQRVRDGGDLQRVRFSPNATNTHVSWLYDARFYVACTEGYCPGLDRPIDGNIAFQVFSDGTFQPICDIKTRRRNWYGGNNFVMLSRDATKVHYGASLTGVSRNYVAVMARPQPPRRVRCEAVRDGVALYWRAPPHHKEIKGYLVYRSERSGDGYDLLTRNPVRAFTWRDTSAKRGRAYYYVVSSLEHCGLESGYSNEAGTAGARGPFVVYAEAEGALKDLKTGDKPGVSRGRDRLGASDWYYVYRSPRARKGAAAFPVDVAAGGEYFVWLRTRRKGKGPAAWQMSIGGRHVGKAACAGPAWTWVRVADSPLTLKAGRRNATLSTSDAGAQADVLCLATSAKLAPRGVRPEDQSAPAATQGLGLVAVRGRTVRLKWRASPEPDFFHYNVYASRRPIETPAQEQLIGSPTYAEFIDWGLRAGVTYHYVVTASDRRGNESPRGAVLRVAIPPRAFPPQELELCFDRAKLTGPFERAKGKGSHGAEYVIIPSKTAAKQTAEAEVSWEINVKHGGEFYFWLRYLVKTATSWRRASFDRKGEVRVDGRVVMRDLAGVADLGAPDSMIRPEFWTWVRPVRVSLRAVKLAAGRHTLTLRKLPKGVRYDCLVITDEPSYLPKDGRLNQRN